MLGDEGTEDSMSTPSQTLSGSEYTAKPWATPGTTWARAATVDVPHHLMPLVSELTALLALPAGWNSYRAKRVRPLAVEAALRLLVDRVWDGPLPSVAPTAPGGVQLEWGSGDDGAELQVGPDGSIHVLIDVRGEMQEYAARGADDPVVTDALTWADKLA